jgi:hypothetical protein
LKEIYYIIHAIKNAHSDTMNKKSIIINNIRIKENYVIKKNVCYEFGTTFLVLRNKRHAGTINAINQLCKKTKPYAKWKYKKALLL